MRILGLLLGVGLALALTMWGIDKVNEPGPTAAEKTGLNLNTGPGEMTAEAKIAACDDAHRNIDAAEESYHAQYGRFADILTLVTAGNLVAAPDQFRVESTDGFATYHLVGQAGCT
jgi:hypothetical protein